MATNPCSSAHLYKSLDFCKGKTILPGVRTRVYYISAFHILSWPTLPESATSNMAELATYEGDFTLESDHYWQYIDLIDNKGKIESESQGDKPARTFLNKFSAAHPETNAEATGFCRQANMDNLVYLVQTRDGKFRMLGNEAFETDTKPKQDSGEGVSGEFGTTLDIQVTDVCPAPFYAGKIQLDATTYIAASTGEKKNQ